MVAKITDRIDALEQRLRQLKTQQQRMEARKRAQKIRRERREDLRRKILVGAIVLALVERGEIAEGQLQRWLDGALTREEDRKLFGLNGVASPLPRVVGVSGEDLGAESGALPRAASSVGLPAGKTGRDHHPRLLLWE